MQIKDSIRGSLPNPFNIDAIRAKEREQEKAKHVNLEWGPTIEGFSGSPEKPAPGRSLKALPSSLATPPRTPVKNIKTTQPPATQGLGQRQALQCSRRGRPFDFAAAEASRQASPRLIPGAHDDLTHSSPRSLNYDCMRPSAGQETSCASLTPGQDRQDEQGGCTYIAVCFPCCIYPVTNCTCSWHRYLRRLCQSWTSSRRVLLGGPARKTAPCQRRSRKNQVRLLSEFIKIASHLSKFHHIYRN